MGKFIKAGRVVVLLQGRMTGKKAVVVKTFDDGSKSRPFSHCLVAGVQRPARKVHKRMSRKQIGRRSTIKPFLKYVNYNHMMPTRYQVPNELGAQSLVSDQQMEQREEDNAAFVEAVDLNKQAVELIQKAKNKLNSFYNPQLVPKEKAPELSPEEELEAGARSVLIQKHSFTQTDSEKLPEGQPEIFAGERKNKGAKGASVMALMDMLAGDINKDTTALEKEEALAQSEYEKLSQDLANQVAESTTAMNNAGATKAKAEEDKQTAESTLSMKEEELADVKQTIADLHAQCDFILQAFEERKAARENEISGLTKAKAILSGAKFD